MGSQEKNDPFHKSFLPIQQNTWVVWLQGQTKINKIKTTHLSIKIVILENAIYITFCYELKEFI